MSGVGRGGERWRRRAHQGRAGEECERGLLWIEREASTVKGNGLKTVGQRVRLG